MALTQESLGNYEVAKEAYKSLWQSSQQTQESRIWAEGYLFCLQNLCEWRTVSDFVDNEIGVDVVAALENDPWKETFLMPHLMSSKLHILAEGKDEVVLLLFEFRLICDKFVQPCFHSTT